MILSDKDASARLNSPNNLINKLKDRRSSRVSAMSLFGVGRQAPPENKESEKKDLPANTSLAPTPKTFLNPFPAAQPVTELEPIKSEPSEKQAEGLEDILTDSDAQIRLGLAHDKAVNLLVNSVDALAAKLDDVKADKLPAVIAAASKTVESIRRERLEQSKQNKGRDVHYHFYTPSQKKITDYEVIDVTQ